MTYVTIADVRKTCGIGSTEISDADVTLLIAECEPQVERSLNTTFTPTERIDIMNGNGTVRMVLDKNPVLALRELKIDGTTITPSYVAVYKESGLIVLDSYNEVEKNIFINKPNAIVVKYVHGFMEENESVITTTTAATIAGTSVSVSVSDESAFTDGNWVEIYSMDGNKEAAKISSSSTGVLVLDQLTQAHESGSSVRELKVSEVVKKLMNVTVSLAMVARIVGQSYTDIVGYNLAEFHAQKGEPYTQWRETANQLFKERDRLLTMIKPRPYMV